MWGVVLVGCVRLAWFVLVVLALSGCTDPPEAPANASPDASARTTDDALVFEGPLTKTTLAVRVVVKDAWVRPNDSILARADAPLGSQVSWFLAPRNPYVPGDDDNLDLVPRSLGVVAPGGLSAPLSMQPSGRFSYALAQDANVIVNVTVVPGAVNPRGSITLVRDAWGLRFAPNEATISPRETIVIRNLARAPFEIVRSEQMLAAAPSGSAASITAPSLLGDYDVVAIAQDSSGGWGSSSARVVVDARKPDADVSLGPYSGAFPTTLGATTPRDENAYSFRFSLENMSLNWTASSPGSPTPVSVRVSVTDANGTVLGRGEGPSGHLLVDAAPHEGRVVVEGLSGVNVQYRVTAEARMILVPPASLFNT